MSDRSPHQFLALLRDLDVALLNRRRQRLVVRTLWLALLTGIIGVAARAWMLLPLNIPLILGLVGLVLGIGLGAAWRSRAQPGYLARTLDQAYGLDAQLGTALELEHRGISEGFAPEVLRQANLLLADVEPTVLAETAVPLRLEWQTLGWMTLFALGMGLLLFTTRPLATEPAVAVPPLPQPGTVAEPPNAPATSESTLDPEQSPPGERPAQGSTPGSNGNTPDPNGQPGSNPQADSTAAAIADALRDNGATRAAADALDRGDTAAAAAELRELAAQAPQLSAETRTDLGTQLDEAADTLDATQPNQADQLRENADQIRAGGADAARGLDELARTVDELGQAPADQAGQPDNANGAGGSGNGTLPGSQTRTNPALPADQQELPLPPVAPEDGPTTSGSGTNDTSISLPGGSGSSNNGTTGGGGSVPDDLSEPSSIPPELRDAIQDYFNH